VGERGSGSSGLTKRREPLPCCPHQLPRGALPLSEDRGRTVLGVLQRIRWWRVWGGACGPGPLWCAHGALQGRAGLRALLHQLCDRESQRTVRTVGAAGSPRACCTADSVFTTAHTGMATDGEGVSTHLAGSIHELPTKSPAGPESRHPEAEPQSPDRTRPTDKGIALHAAFVDTASRLCGGGGGSGAPWEEDPVEVSLLCKGCAGGRWPVGGP
jgi:hypothetical protein